MHGVRRSAETAAEPNSDATSSEYGFPDFLNRPPVLIDDIADSTEKKIVHLVRGLRWKLRLIDPKLDPYDATFSSSSTSASSALNQLLASKSSGKQEWYPKEFCGEFWWKHVFSIIFEEKLIGILLNLPFVVDAAAGWTLAFDNDTGETLLSTRNCPGLQSEDVITNWASMYFSFRRGRLARPSPI